MRIRAYNRCYSTPRTPIQSHAALAMKLLLLQTIIGIAFLIAGAELLGWKKGSIQIPCSGNSNKLLSILNILCNNTQNTSVTTRDACYGCFFRAGSLPTGQTQLVSLSQCATMYLNNTNYNVCAQQLQSVVNGYRPTPSPSLANNCYQGYCEFVRCVRRTNANTMIDACFLQNLVGRDFTRNPDRIAFYTNTSSCILSRARCSAYNPITGELQTVRQPPNQQVPANARFSMYNALQITPAGDIRIVTFPGSTGVAEFFCSTRATLEQDSFDMADC